MDGSRSRTGIDVLNKDLGTPLALNGLTSSGGLGGGDRSLLGSLSRTGMLTVSNFGIGRAWNFFVAFTAISCGGPSPSPDSVGEELCRLDVDSRNGFGVVVVLLAFIVKPSTGVPRGAGNSVFG